MAKKNFSSHFIRIETKGKHRNLTNKYGFRWIFIGMLKKLVKSELKKKNNQLKETFPFLFFKNVRNKFVVSVFQVEREQTSWKRTSSATKVYQTIATLSFFLSLCLLKTLFVWHCFSYSPSTVCNITLLKLSLLFLPLLISFYFLSHTLFFYHPSFLQHTHTHVSKHGHVHILTYMHT